jgi:hypothetical protein
MACFKAALAGRLLRIFDDPAIASSHPEVQKKRCPGKSSTVISR